MENYKTYKPDWAPAEADEKFTCQVMTGITKQQLDIVRDSSIKPGVKKRELSLEEYVEGILACDRMILARAITVIESNAQKHFELGQQIIKAILPYTGKAIRVGITGVPGAGKSTFIEALGNRLCDEGSKLAVLAVDPSSTVSRGSVLGDKTRMETLSKRPKAFIRPSPSGGTLGGVTRKSRETLLLCEAAGFDTILVETVGVGQSETTVRSMVDFFLVIALTGAGDDLQGIKKGVIETADAILVNKADGENLKKALTARSEYQQVLHYLRPATEGWTTNAYTCSAVTGEGISEIWEVVNEFMSSMKESGMLDHRRQQQTLSWVWHMAKEHIDNKISSSLVVSQTAKIIEGQLLAEELSATVAAQILINAIEDELKK